MTFDFLHGIYKINAQMQNRLKSHKLKMQHLDLLFERELRDMKVHSFKKVKNKKYKQLTFSLQLVNETKKRALLEQYFNMCKMVYRIRSTVAYYWSQGEKSLELVNELYTKNEMFAKMIAIVHKNIINLFSGTKSNQKVLGNSKSKKKLQAAARASLKQKMIEDDSAKNISNAMESFNENGEIFMTATKLSGRGVNKQKSQQQQQRLYNNHYERVSELLPKDTATIHRVLVNFARCDLMRNQAFKKELAALDGVTSLVFQEQEEEEEAKVEDRDAISPQSK